MNGCMDFLAATSPTATHLPALLVVGLAIFFGTIGAKIFQRLRIPQVVGYICIGLIVGRSGLQIIDEAAIEVLKPFNIFALGVIGFLIGGELHRDVFRKYGRQFFKILFAEGMGAFFVVGIGTGLVVWLYHGDWVTADRDGPAVRRDFLGDGPGGDGGRAVGVQGPRRADDDGLRDRGAGRRAGAGAVRGGVERGRQRDRPCRVGRRGGDHGQDRLAACSARSRWACWRGSC